MKYLDKAEFDKAAKRVSPVAAKKQPAYFRGFPVVGVWSFQVGEGTIVCATDCASLASVFLSGLVSGHKRVEFFPAKGEFPADDVALVTARAKLLPTVEKARGEHPVRVITTGKEWSTVVSLAEATKSEEAEILTSDERIVFRGKAEPEVLDFECWGETIGTVGAWPKKVLVNPQKWAKITGRKSWKAAVTVSYAAGLVPMVIAREGPYVAALAVIVPPS